MTWAMYLAGTALPCLYGLLWAFWGYTISWLTVASGMAWAGYPLAIGYGLHAWHTAQSITLVLTVVTLGYTVTHGYGAM